MKAHELKIHELHYIDVCTGVKTFEIRKNDRDFKRGDILILREVEATHSGTNESYTGRQKAVKVKYMTNFQQKEGYVVLGISLL